VADPKIFKGGYNLSAVSSFIANTHNELYAFYTEKTAFWIEIWANGGEAAAPPLNQPLELHPYTEQWKQQLIFLNVDNVRQ